MTSLRAAILLEIGTTSGAITGAYLAGILHGTWLYVIFGVMLLGSAVLMLRRLDDSKAPRSARSLGRSLPPARQLLRRFPRPGGRVSRDAHAAGAVSDVRRRPRERAIGHRFRRSQGACHGPRHADTDQGLDGHQQLHDRRDRRGRAGFTSPGRRCSDRRRAGLPGRGAGRGGRLRILGRINSRLLRTSL